jgi:hypothetical protein
VGRGVCNHVFIATIATCMKMMILYDRNYFLTVGSRQFAVINRTVGSRQFAVTSGFDSHILLKKSSNCLGRFYFEPYKSYKNHIRH